MVARGVQRAHDVDQIDDGSNVGRIDPCACELGCGSSADKACARSPGERIDNRLSMSVIEQGLASGLREAGILLVRWQLDAVSIRLQRERRGDDVGVLL